MLGLKVVHISVFFRPKYIVFGYMDTYRVGAVTVRTGFLEGFLTGVSEASIIRLLQALYGIALPFRTTLLGGYNYLLSPPTFQAQCTYNGPIKEGNLYWFRLEEEPCLEGR